MAKSSIVWSLFVISLMYEACANAFDFRYHPNWPAHLERICGDNSDDRISGGRVAAMGQFPWMAQIIINATLENGKSKMHLNCGATLITEQHVVSAAHCIEKFDPVAVVLGEWDTGSDPDCSEDYCADPKKTVPIEKYFVPKEYDEMNSKRHDILLIKLRWPVKFTEWITPICLPTGSEDFPRFGEVAGWGHTSKLGKKSKKLKYVKLPLTPIQICEDAIQYPLDEDSQFCAGASKKDDACVGDSGGPFMQVASTDNGPRYYLTGIVSLGPERCGAGIGVYTTVNTHMKYILDRLN